MPKDKANKVKEEEKTAEQEAEATEMPAAATATSTSDEEAMKAGQVEKEVGAEEVMPAEVAAINTDNETAKEASGERLTEQKEQIKPASTAGGQKENKPVPTGKYADIITQIESLKVTDLAELVKALEERFGVSAAAPMVGSGSAAPSAEAMVAKEEKSTYTLVLTDGGAQKIAVIKAVREIRQDLGLKEAKDLVEGAPKELLKDVKKEEAESAKTKLEAAGAKVELK